MTTNRLGRGGMNFRVLLYFHVPCVDMVAEVETFSVMTQDIFSGCGVNLSNSNPTYCINDAVRQYNRDNITSLTELDRETFLARVFNAFEDLIDTFQTKGPGAAQHLYYKYWLHR